MSLPLRLRARHGSAEAAAEPVTVTVARVVRPDRREAFERWAENVLRVAAGFPGNLGATLLRPGPDSFEYHLVYRFVDDASLAAWERSTERRSVLDHVEEMVDDERYARVSGLESFFTRSAQPGPRWRLTALTIAAVFAITSVMQQFVMPHLANWPLEARLLLSATVVVNRARPRRDAGTHAGPVPLVAPFPVAARYGDGAPVRRPTSADVR